MALEAIHASPQVDHFTLLPEHQEQTPGTFFGGKPVLHLHSPNAKIRISREDFESQPALETLKDINAPVGSEEDVLINEIDIWVNSANLILFSPPKSAGVQISYPTITVHAQEGSAVLLGLNLSDSNTADEDLIFIQLRVIPTCIESHTQPVDDADSQQSNGDSTQFPAQALFKAISECQELNPDPDPSEEEDGAFDETAPGATGWITSDTMQDFVDENGEFRMPQGMTVVGAEDEGGADGTLGAGAGRTRTATEVDGEAGVEDEAKWQRTG